jgi:DNA polymerase-2
MKGFIVYQDYKVMGDKAYVYLYGRLENGESFLTVNSYRPYFYVRESDVTKLKKLKLEIKFEVEGSELKNFGEEAVSKIVLENPKEVPNLRREFEEKGISCYEADIRFVYRFMMDNGIKGAMEIKGEHKKAEGVDRFYEEPMLSPGHFHPKLKTVSIDIETAADASEVYCISLFADDFSKVLFLTDKKLKDAESWKTEEELLKRFREVLKEYDPDIITGWNLIDFDLRVLRDRFEHHKLSFDIGRSNERSILRIQDSFLKDSTANITGRTALDGMRLLKTSFIGLSDYKLQTAAEEILGDTKLKIFDELEKGEEIERLAKKDPQKLASYNLKDAELVIKILEKKGIIDLTVQRSLLTGMELDRVKASIASLDNLYIREATKRGYVCKTSDYSDSEERITGGFVRESNPGIYDFIDVLDFKSLYPSIIRTFNIDPLSFVAKDVKEKGAKQEDLIIAPNGARFKRKIGILPGLIQSLWDQRDEAKKRKNAEESYAIKITMNSFFGVLANPMCRFYSVDMANAITHFGQFIVKKTAELAEEEGYKVIYGDTDSIFVETKAEDLARAKKIGEEIAAHANRYWDKYVKEEHKTESFLELQFEKTFIRFIMPRVRGEETGAKKRYAGMRLVDEKEEISFTGMEFVRRDWTPLAKKFQLELLDRIFHKKEVTVFIKDFAIDLRKGRYDELLVYKKAIRKELIGYTKTTPPHVKAARKLKKLTSSIIEYVITEDGPEPVQQIDHKLDYEHYIDKQVKPIADSVLCFYGKKFDELLNDTKQTKLFGF